MTPEQYRQFGFKAVPILPGNKRCLELGWNKLDNTAVFAGDNLGVGIVPAIGYAAGDIDTYDEGHANHMHDVIRMLIGNYVYRVGRNPKWLIPCECPGLDHKLISKRYRDSTGRIYALELLSPKQQYVTEHIHPGTGKPYTWHGADTVPIYSEQPLITIDTWKNIIFPEFERYAENILKLSPIRKSNSANLKPSEREWTDEQLTYNHTVQVAETLGQYGYDYCGGSKWSRPGHRNRRNHTGSVSANVYMNFSSGDILTPDMAHTPYDIVLAYAFNDDTDAMNRHMSEYIIGSLSSAGFGVGVEVPVGASVTLPPPTEFELVSAGDMVANAKPTDWLIKDILNADSMSELFGAPGSYKSFLALDWALSIAAGIPWFGHVVKQAPVVMIIGEGHNGYAKRIAAWCKHNDVDVKNIPLSVSKVPMQMLDAYSAASVSIAVEQFSKVNGQVGLVCIDTLARNFGGGDENSTADMNRFVTNCDHYLGTGMNKLIIHHTGHGNTDRARGSSVLVAAVDSEYSLTKKDGVITLGNTKMKDDPEFDNMFFEPHAVMVGENFGLFETSIVLVAANKSGIEPEKLSPQMREAIMLLRMLCRESGISCRADWRWFCTKEDIYTRGGFYNAIKTLEQKEVIVITDCYISMGVKY